ncbi:hypothetical protein HDE_04829 [Halotydeus destructor]|nr:hypothetical protein HDE_04829 [Halotydeus destructor]
MSQADEYGVSSTTDDFGYPCYQPTTSSTASSKGVQVDSTTLLYQDSRPCLPKYDRYYRSSTGRDNKYASDCHRRPEDVRG